MQFILAKDPGRERKMNKWKKSRDTFELPEEKTPIPMHRTCGKKRRMNSHYSAALILHIREGPREDPDGVRSALHSFVPILIHLRGT